MHDIVEQVSEGFEIDPTAVLRAPPSLGTDDRTSGLCAAFWNKGAPKQEVVSTQARPDFAILSFHLDRNFELDFQVDQADVYRGRTGPGDYCLVPPGKMPVASLRGDAAVFHIYLPRPLFDKLSLGTSAEQPLFGSNSRLHGHIRELVSWRDQAQMTELDRFAAYGGLIRMVAALARGLSPLAGPERLPAHQLNRAYAYMEKNLAEPVRIPQIAAELNMSEAHFARAFRNTCGRTPGEALKAFRMKMARKLLRSDTIGVLDVSVAVGYADPGFFARVFREVHGTTPSRWRKQQRNSL